MGQVTSSLANLFEKDRIRATGDNKLDHIPDELFTAILSISLEPDSREGSSQPHFRTKRLLQLASVATRWWHAISESPTLWTTIQTDHTALSLRRSATLPIDIEADESKAPCSVQFGNLISRHAHRWRSMRWKGSEGSPELDTIVTEQLYPLLEVLELSAASWTARRLPNIGAPRLRVLRLSSVIVPLPQEGLQELKVFSLSALGVDEYPTTISLLIFLASCPALEEIHLESLGWNLIQWGLDVPPGLPTLPQPLGSFVFPSLHTLCLKYVLEGIIAEFLLSIRAENLSCFSLVAGFGGGLWTEAIVAGLPENDERSSILETVCRNAPGGNVYVEAGHMNFELKYQHAGVEGLNAINIKINSTPFPLNLNDMVTALQPDRINIDIPIHFRIQHPNNADRDDPDQFIHPRILDKLPGLVKLQVQDAVNTRFVLEHLAGASPMEGWPCPNLREICLDGDIEDEDDMEAALEAIRLLAEHRAPMKIYDGTGTAYHQHITRFMGYPLM